MQNNPYPPANTLNQQQQNVPSVPNTGKVPAVPSIPKLNNSNLKTVTIVANKNSKVPPPPKISLPVPKIPKPKPVVTNTENEAKPIEEEKPAKPDFRSELFKKLSLRSGNVGESNDAMNTQPILSSNSNEINQEGAKNFSFANKLENQFNSQNDTNAPELHNKAREFKKTSTYTPSSLMTNTRKFNIKDDDDDDEEVLFKNVALPLYSKQKSVSIYTSSGNTTSLLNQQNNKQKSGGLFSDIKEEEEEGGLFSTIKKKEEPIEDSNMLNKKSITLNKEESDLSELQNKKKGTSLLSKSIFL